MYHGDAPIMQVELDMGDYNCLFLYTVMADLRYDLGRIHSELEEFEEAQKHLQGYSEIVKTVFNYTVQATCKTRKFQDIIWEIAADSMTGTNLQLKYYYTAWVD